MTENGEAHSPAPLHLLKMAVGIADLDDLRRVRAARIAQLGGSCVYTRNHPRRAEAVLRGGSLYWVIRGQIRVRQRITGFRSERDEKGRAYCLIEVDTGAGRDRMAAVAAVPGLALSVARRRAAGQLRRAGGGARSPSGCGMGCRGGWRVNYAGLGLL